MTTPKTWDEVVLLTGDAMDAVDRDGSLMPFGGAYTLAETALRALIANGYAIVPREATEEMCAVGDHLDVARAGVAYLWSAALSAGEIAPKKDPSP